MYVPIILGTARLERQSEKVASFMKQEVCTAGLRCEIIDVDDYRIRATDNTERLMPAQKFSEKVSGADGFIIVTPEYNHGYPGELKMMLDMLYSQYARKPIGFCGVSAGFLGGARAVEQLRLVAIELHMVPIREALYFPNVVNLFYENGSIKDESYVERIRIFLDELTWYARALKKARESDED